MSATWDDMKPGATLRLVTPLEWPTAHDLRTWFVVLPAGTTARVVGRSWVRIFVRHAPNGNRMLTGLRMTLKALGVGVAPYATAVVGDRILTIRPETAGNWEVIRDSQ